MKSFSFLVLMFFSITLSAQTKSTFDIVTYNPPAGWKEAVSENMISYTFVDKLTSNWCQINIVKSTVSKGGIDQDFESEWKELMVKNYRIIEVPQTTEVQNRGGGGWKIKAGTGKFTFNKNNVNAILSTMSGYDRCVSVVTTTNSQTYLKDLDALLESIELINLGNLSTEIGVTADDKNSVLGTWGANASDNSNYRMKNGAMNYISRQYTFKSNGTYIFITKTFDPLVNKILLGKENGDYQIISNTIIITPQKSVLEGWSKKGGVDQWGELLQTQNIPLENITYRFTKHFFEGSKKWNLVLQSDNITNRDGQFSGNTTFANAWYYGPISSINESIKLPAGQALIEEAIRKDPVQPNTINNNTDIVGSWGITASDQSSFRVKNGVISTIFRQYTFNTDGAYSFIVKTFDPLMDKILLGRENGTYRINGNDLSINPQTNVLEAWSKKNGTDWGNLLNTQTLPMEKSSYQFVKRYNNTFKEWQLILQADKVTQRDGPFSNNNGWIYIAPSSARPLIKLPGE